MAAERGEASSGSHAAVQAHTDELREVVVGSALFGAAGWEDAVLADILAGLTTAVVRGGEIVVREGEASDDLLLVVSGRLRVVRASVAGEPATVAEIGRGETVGETGLITHEPRTATVYAVRDSILARLTRERFELLCARHPQVMIERLAGGMLRRLLQEARGEQWHREGFSGAIALVAAGRPPAWRWLADELLQQLAGQGPAVAVTQTSCDRLLERDGACAGQPSAEEEAKLARWLGTLERQHRFLLYEADGGGGWDRRCVRQADHTVLVSAAEAGPQPGLLAALSSAEAVRPTLSVVLLHQGGGVRAGAAAPWQGVVPVDRIHHVRVGDGGDVARLARLLTGTGTALVIGGGGARAFAAVGIARALAEAGIAVDTVAGVSAGAIVAALIAAGLSPQELISRCRGVSRRVDYTIPVHALTRGRNWSAALADLFGDTAIDDLLLPYFCTAVNLSRAELIVHDSGPLLHAVRASTAIPGILPPVWHDGDLLVDGGLMNNLPIAMAHARAGVGRVMAVDVTRPRVDDPREPFGYHVSGWRALGGRITRRHYAGLPTVIDLLMRSMLVSDAETRRGNRRLAAMIFEPSLNDYALMDWRQVAAIAELGYRHAVAQLAGEATGPPQEQAA